MPESKVTFDGGPWELGAQGISSSQLWAWIDLLNLFGGGYDCLGAVMEGRPQFRHPSQWFWCCNQCEDLIGRFEWLNTSGDWVDIATIFVSDGFVIWTGYHQTFYWVQGMDMILGRIIHSCYIPLHDFNSKFVKGCVQWAWSSFLINVSSLIQNTIHYDFETYISKWTKVKTKCKIFLGKKMIRFPQLWFFFFDYFLMYLDEWSLGYQASFQVYNV